MASRTGIELLRYAVNILNRNNESFNERFTEEQLIRIAFAMESSKWDYYPDQWTERQVQECIQFNIVPSWKEKNGEIVPSYKNEGDQVFSIETSWTVCATAMVYASSKKEAKEWAENDMPTPMDSEYLSDSFEVGHIEKEE